MKSVAVAAYESCNCNIIGYNKYMHILHFVTLAGYVPAQTCMKSQI